eukprot:777787-Pyramimonas_sp.AAC.1
MLITAVPCVALLPYLANRASSYRWCLSVSSIGFSPVSTAVWGTASASSGTVQINSGPGRENSQPRLWPESNGELL